MQYQEEKPLKQFAIEHPSISALSPIPKLVPSVRLAIEGDQVKVTNLNKSLLINETFISNPLIAAPTLAIGQGRCLVGELDYKLVAAATFDLTFSGNCLEIETLIVHQDFRRNGFGSLLINSLKDQGKKHGCAFLMVNTAVKYGAVPFYKAIGFTDWHGNSGTKRSRNQPINNLLYCDID